MTSKPANVVVDTTPKSPVNNRGRLRGIPVHSFISMCMDRKGAKTVDVARDTGLKPNVISMLRSGGTRIAPNKVPALARAIDADPADLMERVLTESNPDLWAAIQQIMKSNTAIVTDKELQLLHVARASLDGLSPDFVADEKFMQAFQAALNDLGAREFEANQRELAAIEARRKQRSESGVLAWPGTVAGTAKK